MLNPVALRLNEEDGLLRLGFPTLDPVDHRVASDVGLTPDELQAATRRHRRNRWASAWQAIHRSLGTALMFRRTAPHN